MFLGEETASFRRTRARRDHATDALTLADIVDRGDACRLDAALENLGDPARKELSSCIEEVPFGTSFVERLYPSLSRVKQAAMGKTRRSGPTLAPVADRPSSPTRLRWRA